MIQTEGYDAIKNNLTVISPDTGAMDRAIYYAMCSVWTLGCSISVVITLVWSMEKNPIVQHEYIGSDLTGKNVLIIDDMVASGESICDIIKETSHLNIQNTYVATTIAFLRKVSKSLTDFTPKESLTKLYTTNLTYVPDQVRKAPWFCEVDLRSILQNSSTP